jgi:hypothetical protein
MSYQPKVYRDNGGDRQVIASSGEQKVESGGIVRIESGGRLLDEQAAGGARPALVFQHDITLAHAVEAATSQSLTVGDKIQIIDVFVQKTGGGSSGSTSTLSVTLKTSTGGAITDAIDIKKPDKTIVRAGKIDDAFQVIAAGGSIKAVRAGTTAAGSSAATKNLAAVVRVIAVKRS